MSDGNSLDILVLDPNFSSSVKQDLKMFVRTAYTLRDAARQSGIHLTAVYDRSFRDGLRFGITQAVGPVGYRSPGTFDELQNAYWQGNDLRHFFESQVPEDTNLEAVSKTMEQVKFEISLTQLEAFKPVTVMGMRLPLWYQQRPKGKDENRITEGITALAAIGVSLGVAKHYELHGDNTMARKAYAFGESAGKAYLHLARPRVGW